MLIYAVMSQPILIKNAHIITPFETIAKGSIFVSSGKIRDIRGGRYTARPKGAKVIDAKGKFVVPGFIDVHLQGAGGSDVLDGTKTALRRIAKSVALSGTTSFLATTVVTGKDSPHLGIIDTIMKEGTGGADILGIHLEGPYINPMRKGMIKIQNIRRASSKDLPGVLRLCRGRLKMMTVAPELPGALNIIATLKKRGVIVSVGHTEASYEKTRSGLKTGASHVTHLFNAMPPLHHRAPGALSAIFEDEKCTAQVIADGIHLHPSIVRLLVKVLGVERIVLITDSMASAGLPDGPYVYNGLNFTSKRGTARYHSGTLIGTSLMLREITRRFMKIAGVSLNDAVRCATFNPAYALGLEHTKGSIDPGKDADLVIMDRQFNIKHVMIRGKLLF